MLLSALLVPAFAGGMVGSATFAAWRSAQLAWAIGGVAAIVAAGALGPSVVRCAEEALRAIDVPPADVAPVRPTLLQAIWMYEEAKKPALARLDFGETLVAAVGTSMPFALLAAATGPSGAAIDLVREVLGPSVLATITMLSIACGLVAFLFAYPAFAIATAVVLREPREPRQPLRDAI